MLRGRFGEKTVTALTWQKWQIEQSVWCFHVLGEKFLKSLQQQQQENEQENEQVTVCLLEMMK